MKKLALNSPHMVIFDNSHGIQLLESEHECSHGAAADEHIHTAECNHDHDHDHAEEHSHAEIHSHEDGDPHIWTSPRNAKIIASNMLKAFITLDPENEEFFKENYNSLIREIEAVDDSITGMLSSTNGKSFVIYHPSLTYFANDYGLNQISIENLGKEPSAMYLKTLVDSIRTNGTKVFFIQKEFDTKNAEILAREVNGKIVQIDPLNENWSEEMINIAKELK